MGWLRRWWWAGPRALAWLGAGLLLVAAVVAAGLFAAGGWSTSRAGNEAEFTRLVDVSQIASAGMAAVGLALSLVSVLVGARRSSSQRRADAAADLDTYRGKVHEFWNVEARHEGLRDPHPIEVRWRPGPHEVRPAAGADVFLPNSASEGILSDLPGWFEQNTRHHQLVILGPAGAGKSAALVLLTVELTRTTRWVPVHMTARGWRPETQTVAELFREELESRQLGHLADSQWILPIIDGLDEIDASSYEAAIKRIREHSADRKPLIATSRTQEYVDATRQAGHTPAWAAVIQLDPITALQVCSYLTQDSPDTTWWAPVTDKLASDPAGPLARALSTPLMAWLARATLTPSIGPHSPTPLDLAGVASFIEARQLLLNHYLPTQYRADYKPPGPPGARLKHATRRRPYNPDTAQRWLTTLTRSHRMTWHTIPTRWIHIPLTWVDVAVAAALALLLTLLFTRTAALTDPAAYARPGLSYRHMLAAAIISGTVLLTSGHTWRQPWRDRRSIPVWVAVAAVAGLTAATPIAGVVCAFGAVLFARAATSTRPTKRTRIDKLNKGVLDRILIGSLAVFQAIGAARTGRGRLIVLLLTGGAVGWLFFDLTWATFLVALVVFPPLALHLWPRVQKLLARPRLAAAGLIPWRLDRFLADAHSRGVVRATPPGHQIRHQILASHLADSEVLRHQAQPARIAFNPDDIRSIDTRCQALAATSQWDSLVTMTTTTAYSSRWDYPHDLPPGWLVDTLVAHGAVTEWERRADAGNSTAADWLAKTLAARGDLEGLERRADASGFRAKKWLDEVLVARGDLEGLERRVDAGDLSAEPRLARFLVACGDLEGLERRADAGDSNAGPRLDEVLVARGDLEGLERRADAGDSTAERLAEFLVNRGDLDWLERRADAGDSTAEKRLDEVLVARGDLEELERRADAQKGLGTWKKFIVFDGGGIESSRREVINDVVSARELLAEALVARGDLEGLERRADAGDLSARERLAEFLVNRGDLDRLERRADAGDLSARAWLAEVSVGPSGLAWLERRADAGFRRAQTRLAKVLASRGDLDRLEQRAYAYEQRAEQRLARVLVARGDLDRLEGLADARGSPAEKRLAEVLVARGDLKGLERRADAGDSTAEERLAEFLVNRGDLDWLERRADAGDSTAEKRLAEVLVARGDLEGLERRADAGGSAAAYWLAEALVARGDLEGLERRAATGDRRAWEWLAEAFAARGDLNRLEQQANAYSPPPPRSGAMVIYTGESDRDPRVLLADAFLARGDLEGLERRADAGDEPARERLNDLLAARGDLDRLERRADAGDEAAAQGFAQGLFGRGDIMRLRLRAERADRPANYWLAVLLAWNSYPEELATLASADPDAARYLDEVDRLHRLDGGALQRSASPPSPWVYNALARLLARVVARE